MISLKLTYSEPLMRRAIRSYWRRNIGAMFPAVTAALTAFVVYRVAHGDRSWVTGTIGAVVLLAVLVMGGSYRVYLRRSLGRFRRMKTPEATLELGDDGFRAVSDAGAVEMPYSAVRKVWRFDGAWLLFFSAGEFITLPTEGLTAEAREVIVTKVSAHGARVE